MQHSLGLAVVLLIACWVTPSACKEQPLTTTANTSHPTTMIPTTTAPADNDTSLAPDEIGLLVGGAFGLLTFFGLYFYLERAYPDSVAFPDSPHNLNRTLTRESAAWSSDWQPEGDIASDTKNPRKTVYE